MRFGKMPSCVSARRAPLKETLAGFFWLASGWLGLAPGWLGLAPGWLSGWFGLAWLLAGLVWLLAGFLAGLVWLLAGLAWLLAGFLAGLAFWLVWLGSWLAFWLVWFGFWLAFWLVWLGSLFFPCFFSSPCRNAAAGRFASISRGLYILQPHACTQRFRLRILCRTRSNAGRTSAGSLSGRI